MRQAWFIDERIAVAKKQQAESNEVTITLPLADPPPTGYERIQAEAGRVALDAPDRIHVNAQLGQAAARAFLRIRNGLRESNAKLSSGKPVFTATEALQWLCEQVAEQI